MVCQRVSFARLMMSAGHWGWMLFLPGSLGVNTLPPLVRPPGGDRSPPGSRIRLGLAWRRDQGRDDRPDHLLQGPFATEWSIPGRCQGRIGGRQRFVSESRRAVSEAALALWAHSLSGRCDTERDPKESRCCWSWFVAQPLGRLIKTLPIRGWLAFRSRSGGGSNRSWAPGCGAS